MAADPELPKDGPGMIDLRRRLGLSGSIFEAARKRSITIAGHATSVRIESAFWDALVADSRALGIPLSALVAEIDAARLASPSPPNLASALRLWAMAHRDTGREVRGDEYNLL
jgi:predicted DNA-binding ribbon-helix-helix protein